MQKYNTGAFNAQNKCDSTENGEDNQNIGNNNLNDEMFVNSNEKLNKVGLSNPSLVF